MAYWRYHINPFGTMSEEEKAQFIDGEVPLYRSYGVKRKVHPVLDTLLHSFYVMIALSILFVTLGVLVAICGAVFSLSGALAKLFFYILFATVILEKPVRLVFKRARFSRKLKRQCRKLGYRLTYEYSFWATLVGRRFNKIHFFVDTGKKLYAVQYLTFPKYMTHVTFTAPGEMVVTTRLIRSTFHTMFGIKPKNKKKPYSFPPVTMLKKREIIPVLLMNPVPHSMFTIDHDGVRQAAGTGSVLKDGTVVFSGTGFLSTLDRESRD